MKEFAKFFPLRVNPLLEVICSPKSKQEVTKGVSICKKGQTHSLIFCTHSGFYKISQRRGLH